MTRSLIIVGAGGHAAVVADAWLSAGATLLGFTDVNQALHGDTVCGYPVLGDDTVLDAYEPLTVWLANGIGTRGVPEDRLRRSSEQRMRAAGWEFATVRHPAAIVSRFATVAAGSQLFANSVVQVGAAIGRGAIVNTGAIVEHDTKIGEWTHLAPGAVVCGGVTIGDRSFVGAGAVVRQGLRLGDDTVVAAGAVVVEDFPAGGKLVGVPARLVAARI